MSWITENIHRHTVDTSYVSTVSSRYTQTEIIGETDFGPNQKDPTFKLWHKIGLNIFGQFIGKGGVLKFE